MPISFLSLSYAALELRLHGFALEASPSSGPAPVATSDLAFGLSTISDCFTSPSLTATQGVAWGGEV